MGFLKDFYKSSKELIDIFDQGFKEIGECATDGFKEIVIKGNSNYQTSYEKRDQANWIIASAQESLKSKIEEVNKSIQTTDGLLKKHYNFKRDIMEGNLKETQQVLSAFIEMDIKNLIISEPVRKNIEVLKTAVNTQSSAAAVPSFASLGSSLGIFRILESAYLQSKRVEAANQYLEDARDYQSQARLQVEELEMVNTKMAFIHNSINDERRMLDVLLSKLGELTDQTRQNLTKGSFTPNEADEAQAIWEIAEAIKESCVSIMLNDKLELSDQYLKAIKKLKILENKIKEGRIGI